MDASKPMGIYYGTVTSVSPLEILLEQKIPLSAEFLILTSAVQDYEVSMTVEHQTDAENDHTHQYFDSDTGMAASGSTTRTSEATTHFHTYSGTKTFKIHNALKTGDKVVMLRVQGGQQFLVLDKVR